jgi:hypothetical protein
MCRSFFLRPIAYFVFIAVTASIAPSVPQAPIPTQIPGQNAILMGTAWYPEQWPESRWEQDLRLMEAADLKVVRIAEFAWSRMEPSEGHYDFDWLERAINLAAKHRIISVPGTPTATPPAWLTQKYPETLRVEPMVNASSTATERMPQPPLRATANSAAASQSRWRYASDTIATSWAGKSTMNTAIPRCLTTMSRAGNFRIGCKRNTRPSTT